ncbi:LacI family DNA-binding transcriptional regulator [Cryobacterium soli]|uniref:LacI family DNA-binding transcriptional regulator n=1 Tax=Cryobacterium soli TaxID=2220095 RepID=UPI000E753821|nr:LacI family DNA-binding transcriptional regulator [Cryobacterium soli]
MKDTKLAEVARLAGVSPGTVSNAFNRPNVVAAETITRIMDAVAELNYVPNGAARQLRVGSSSTIGLVLHDLGSPFLASLAEGAEEHASGRGFSLLIATTNRSPDKQRGYLELFEEQRVKGILLQPNGLPQDSLERLKLRGIPVVLLDPPPSDANISSVSGDDFEGGRIAARHLLEIGCRRILVLPGPTGVRSFDERELGAKEEIDRVPGASCFTSRSDTTMTAGRAAGEQLTREGGFDGVFAGTDMIALGVLQALAQHGVSVPNDVAVIGYDDIEIASVATVPLSSVRQPARRMGQTAIDLLFERFDAPSSARHQVVFRPELVVRSSTRR